MIAGGQVKESEKVEHINRFLCQAVPSGNRWWRSLLPVFAVLLPAQAAAQDFFTGMVTATDAGLVLERCNLAQTRYRLMAAEGAGEVLAPLTGGDGLLQADVIARYRADGDAHVLEVLSVERVQPGRSCHLLDAIDSLLAASGATPGPQANEDRWDALAAGAAAPADVQVIGSGDYAYRFTLMHPHTGRPSPDTDYALSASRSTNHDLPFVTDEKKVFQGRTDSEGRTPVFRLPLRLPDAAFDLRERFGSGPYGETFHLTDHDGNSLPDMPYLVITCTAPPRYFRGYTYPGGHTAYTASDGPINIQLRVLDDIDEPPPTSCKDGMGEDNPVPATDGEMNRSEDE